MIAPHAYDRVKRIVEFGVAGLLLLLTAPVTLIVAGAVALNLGRPVLFRQPRPGLRGELFELVKFRTMRPSSVADGRVADGERLTRFGRWLRSTSLDELPTLWNVLRGDMSLVGPRPLLVQYLHRYTAEQARRHEVRPGVTGLAQVRGRNALTWEQRFAYDVWYVDNRGPGLDLRILGATVRAVLRREGITAPGRATIDEFRGTYTWAAPARVDRPVRTTATVPARATATVPARATATVPARATVTVPTEGEPA